MDWPDSIGDAFPSQRVDEPKSLREDIVDELSDHLATAMQRELRTTEDENVARRNVLARFGDPAKLARQLWWAAMKEIVMRDRIVLAVFSVLALACLATAAFAMLMVREGREVNAAILAKLETVVQAEEKRALPADWAKLRFRVTDQREGKPVKGLKITVTGETYNVGKQKKFYTHTDKQGNAVFGPYRPGSYKYNISTERFRRTDTFVLYPGREREISIVTPVEDDGKLSVSVDWPADLKDKGLVGFFTASRTDKITVKRKTWSAPSKTLVVTSDGRILEDKTKLYLKGAWDMKDVQLAEHIVLPAASYRVDGLKISITEDHSDRPGFMSLTGYPWGTGSRSFNYPKRVLPSAMPYDVEADRENHWRIELPEKTLELIRKWVADVEHHREVRKQS